MGKPNTLFKQTYNRTLELLATCDALPSEPRLGEALSVSRTTVRAVLTRLAEAGVIVWDKRDKRVLRRPLPTDYFSASEVDQTATVVERWFMQRILTEDAVPGQSINELEMARALGVSTGTVREFLIRFSRFGLIEKRRHSTWALKGFTREFALELTDVREMFELRSARLFASLPTEHRIWRELDSIEDEHRQMLETIERSYRDFSPFDERFHRLVHSAAYNRFIDSFYDVIAMVFHYHYQWNKSAERVRNEAAITEHLDYIRALRSRDPIAVEQACTRHLTSARETLLASIRFPREGRT